MVKIKTKQVIRVQDWDELVEQTYGKPYNFQQQAGCQDRGNFDLTIPDEAEDFENDKISISDIINGRERGVSFASWLKRDPKEWNGLKPADQYRRLFWFRNFYPNIQMIANDLHAKGLLPAGELTIEIDW